MPESRELHPMQKISAHVRAARHALVRDRRLSVLDARGLFLSSLVAGVLRERAGSSPQAQHPPDVAYELQSSLGAIPCFALREVGWATDTFAPSADLIKAVADDPIHLGWAYQFWNESERDDATWAISRRGEDPELSSVAAATQVFTEDYMARFLLARCVAGLEKTSWRGTDSFLDPACGTGHILAHVVRTLAAETRLDGLEILSAVHGCDIDADAVEVCRIVVLLEVMRRTRAPLADLWQRLQSQVQALDHAYGSLDRTSKLEMLGREHRCIVTNPPYIGRRKMTKEMRGFLDAEYPDTSMDLFSAFTQRCVELTAPGGMLGLVTVDKWLRLKGHEALRTGGMHFGGLYQVVELDVVCELGARAFSAWSSLHDGVGTTLLTARRKPAAPGHLFHFISCSESRGPREKEQVLLSWTRAGVGGLRVEQDSLRDATTSTNYVVHSGMPVSLRSAAQRVGDVARVVVGLQTSDDRRFVRYVWSVPPDKQRWLVHGKGGGYERWYGLNRFLLDWHQGRPVFERDPKSGLSVERWFAEDGWTYTWFAHGALGLRRKERGWSFGRAASSALFCDDIRLVAFLNSRVASLAVRRLGGKAQLPEGVVRALPIPDSLDALDPTLIATAVELKRMLVRDEITDVTYQPGNTFIPQRSLRAQALLLVVEGELERQVAECLKLSDSERRLLDDVFGRPVAWNPRYDGVQATDVRTFLSVGVEGLLRECAALSIGENASDTLAAHIRHFFERRARAVVPHRGVPAGSLLEQLCRWSGAHPFDVECVVSRRLESDPAIQREIFAPFVRARIIGETLSSLGHQWWSATEQYDASLHAERSACEVAEYVSQRMPGVDFLRVLGEDLVQWIATQADRYQARLMCNTPLMTVRRTGRSRDFVFSHGWSLSCPADAYCL